MLECAQTKSQFSTAARLDSERMPTPADPVLPSIRVTRACPQRARICRIAHPRGGTMSSRTPGGTMTDSPDGIRTWPTSPDALTDTHKCPGCFTPVTVPVCPVCGFVLTDPRALEVLALGRSIVSCRGRAPAPHRGGAAGVPRRFPMRSRSRALPRRPAHDARAASRPSRPPHVAARRRGGRTRRLPRPPPTRCLP